MCAKQILLNCVKFEQMEQSFKKTWMEMCVFKTKETKHLSITVERWGMTVAWPTSTIASPNERIFLYRNWKWRTWSAHNSSWFGNIFGRVWQRCDCTMFVCWCVASKNSYLISAMIVIYKGCNVTLDSFWKRNENLQHTWRANNSCKKRF